MMRIEVSQTIARPVAAVFRFYAHEHVRNHPRWDPYMELEQITPGPIGVGTVIRRRSSRSGTPVEGTMEVVEFEPERAMGVLIHDGPVEMRGQATFEANGTDETLLTVSVEVRGMGIDTSIDPSALKSGIEQSLRNARELIEAEV